MTTNVPKTPTSIFSMKETFNQTNAKNKFQPNIPLNETVKAPTTLMPIHKNMFVDFTTETPETNNFRTTRPKEMFKVANHLNTKPFVSTQIICNQNPFDARCSTIPRQPIQCIPGSDSKQCLHQKPFTIQKEPNPQTPKEIFSNPPLTPNSNSFGLKCTRQPDGSVLCDTDPQNCFPGSQDPACQQIGISPICFDGSPAKDCQRQGNLVKDQGVACLLGITSPDCEGQTETTKPRLKPPKGMFVDPIKINNHDCQPGSSDLECFIGTPFQEQNIHEEDSQDPIRKDKEIILNVNCILNPNLPRCKVSGLKMFGLVKENDPNTRFVMGFDPLREKPKDPFNNPIQMIEFARDPLINQIQEDPRDQTRQKGPIKNSKLKGPNNVDSRFTFNPSKPTKEENVGQTSRDPMISEPRDPKTSLSILSLKFPKTQGIYQNFPKLTTNFLPCLPGSKDPNCRQIPSTSLCSLNPNQPGCRLPQCRLGDSECRVDGFGTICFPQSGNPRCLKAITCSTGSQDPACQFMETLKPPRCDKFSNDPRCRGSISPKICLPDSQDPECQFDPESKNNFEFKKSCQDGSIDPECANTNKENKLCISGSRDPECHPNERDKEETRPKKKCILGIQDEDCLTVDEDEKLDKNEKKACIPGSGDINCWPFDKDITDPMLICNPESGDPDCKSGDQEKRDPKKICFPGSDDPQCEKSEPKLEGTDLNKICIEGSGDPRCWPVPINPINDPETKEHTKCLPGSKDRNCLPISENPAGSFDPNKTNTCIPGSGDPVCWPYDNKIQNCPENSLDPNCAKQIHNCAPGSQDPACTVDLRCELGSNDPECIESTPVPIPDDENKNNLIKCEENPSNPECFVDKDQKEREKLCLLIPSSPICQTLNIVPANQEIECSDDSPDQICRPVIQDIVSKEGDPSEKGSRCNPGSSEPRCAIKYFNKQHNAKPFVNLGNPKQIQENTQNKKQRDPKNLIENQTKDRKPSIENPNRFRKPKTPFPRKPSKITKPNSKPFTAFRTPTDPDEFSGKTKIRNKDPSEEVRQQEKDKVPEDNNLSFKTPPIVQQKTQKDPDAKTGSKEPTFKVLRPSTRQPKQFNDSPEPVAEPEPGDDFHSPGSNPRTHAFHSWLYQKIDPKVRAARRKKFFGTGRKKRQIPDEYFEEIYSIEPEEGEEEEERKDQETQIIDPSFHAFHLWQRQKVDQTKSSRRRKLLREGRSFALLRQKPHSIAKRDSNSEKISINLGVKRITIDDSLLDILPPETHRRTLVEQKTGGAESQPEVKYIMVPNSSVAVAFCMFVMLFFLALSVVFSTVFQHKRYIIRKL